MFLSMFHVAIHVALLSLQTLCGSTTRILGCEVKRCLTRSRCWKRTRVKICPTRWASARVMTTCDGTTRVDDDACEPAVFGDWRHSCWNAWCVKSSVKVLWLLLRRQLCIRVALQLWRNTLVGWLTRELAWKCCHSFRWSCDPVGAVVATLQIEPRPQKNIPWLVQAFGAVNPPIIFCCIVWLQHFCWITLNKVSPVQWYPAHIVIRWSWQFPDLFGIIGCLDWKSRCLTFFYLGQFVTGRTCQTFSTYLLLFLLSENHEIKWIYFAIPVSPFQPSSAGLVPFGPFVHSEWQNSALWKSTRFCSQGTWNLERTKRANADSGAVLLCREKITNEVVFVPQFYSCHA